MSYLKMLEQARGETSHYPGVFQIGDLVRLRSGGPVMVVSETGQDGYIGVEWMDKAGVLQSKALKVELVRRHENVVRKWAS